MAQTNPSPAIRQTTGAKSDPSPRNVNAVAKACKTALQAMPEAERPAVMKAVMQKFQAEEKAQRAKQAEAKMKAKATEHARKVKAEAIAAKAKAAGTKVSKPKASRSHASERAGKQSAKRTIPPAPMVSANSSTGVFAENA